MPKLTKQDWAEIYYALDSKAHMIERGDLGEDGEDGVDNQEWIDHLRAIMETIGPDGSSMYSDDTEQQDKQFLELLWDCMKRDPEHKDRVRTGWGTKTKVGLVACLHRIAEGH